MTTAQIIFGILAIWGGVSAEFCGSPFKADLKTAANKPITFAVIFNTNYLLISNSQLECTAENQCKVDSRMKQYDKLEQDTYEYLEITVTLFDQRGHSFTVKARHTTLEHSYLGVHHASSWSSELKNLNIKIDPLTGALELVPQLPATGLVSLVASKTTNQLILPGTLNVEAMAGFFDTPSRSDSQIEFQFPKSDDINLGQFYFVVSKDHLARWEEFLTVIWIVGKPDVFQLNLKFEGKTWVSANSDFFTAFDGSPFKVHHWLGETMAHQVGKFFAEHNKMKIFMQFGDTPDRPKVFLELTPGPLITYGLFSYFPVLNLLSWLLTLVALALIAYEITPPKYKLWIRSDISNRALIH